MTEEQIEHFEGLLIKAVQSGKRETSDLVDGILHKMEPVIAQNIEKYVNGHIRDIKTHLTEQDIKLDALDKKIIPLDENRMTVLRVGRFVIWLGALSGAAAAIIWLVDKIRTTQ